ncbi:hypothetical protein PMAYCL1PPCAC_03497, partial [Pristionchus mayeri]
IPFNARPDQVRVKEELVEAFEQIDNHEEPHGSEAPILVKNEGETINYSDSSKARYRLPRPPSPSVKTEAPDYLESQNYSLLRAQILLYQLDLDSTPSPLIVQQLQQLQQQLKQLHLAPEEEQLQAQLLQQLSLRLQQLQQSKAGGEMAHRPSPPLVPLLMEPTPASEKDTVVPSIDDGEMEPCPTPPPVPIPVEPTHASEQDTVVPSIDYDETTSYFSVSSIPLTDEAPLAAGVTLQQTQQLMQQLEIVPSPPPLTVMQQQLLEQLQLQLQQLLQSESAGETTPPPSLPLPMDTTHCSAKDTVVVSIDIDETALCLSVSSIPPSVETTPASEK